MSETVTSTASAGQSAPTTGAQSAAPQAQGAQAQAGNQSPGQPAPQAKETAQEKQGRILSEQDLDAYVMQKINGKEEKVKLRDLQKAYGLDKTANQRMQEAAQARKQVDQLVNLFQTDFNKFCEVTGIDKQQFLRQNLATQKDIAEEILAQEYERSQMDPNQRRAMELEEQLKTYQQRDLEQKKPLIDKIKELVPEKLLPKGIESASAEELNQFLQVKQQEFQQGIDNLSNELLGAWQATGLPKQKEFGQWMAQMMMDHQKRTGEALQPEIAAAKVKTRFLASTQSLLSQMDAPAIQEVLGEAIVQKLRDYDVSRVTQQGPQFGAKNNDQATAVNEPKKYMNQFEWRKAHGLG